MKADIEIINSGGYYEWEPSDSCYKSGRCEIWEGINEQFLAIILGYADPVILP